MDPKFPRVDEDKEYLSKLEGIQIKPIFIMGLHRSGTTFLYDSVAQCFPVANLDLYHIFYFDRLIKNTFNDNESHDRVVLNQYFRSAGITDRKIDKVWVEDSMVEEYGWLLRNHSYAMSITEENADYFKLICQKLHYLHPNAEAILLKNPFDTDNAQQILKRFPGAKFIYISREPTAILNSMVNAILTYLTGRQPFLTLLIDRFKMPVAQPLLMRLSYGIWKIARGIKSLLGEERAKQIIVPYVADSVELQIKNYFLELNELPEDSYFELTYHRFNEDPEKYLLALQNFLGLPLTQNPQCIRPQPRKNEIDSLVQEYGNKLQQNLAPFYQAAAKRIDSHHEDLPFRRSG